MTTDEDKESLKRADIKRHYRREEVRNIIRKYADYKGCHKSGKHDETGLYQYKKNQRRLMDFCNDPDYNFIIRNADRVILSTLNYFKTDLFGQWTPKEDPSPGGFPETEYFSLSVDIDLADDYTVNDAKALAALRTAGKFIHQRLSNVTCGKLLAMFSGNGVYIHLHPHLAYLGDGYTADEKVDLFDELTKAFNLYLQELESALYVKYPQVHGLVKIDALNNRKRYFKTVMSLHRKLPYVVFPIDPEDDFQILLKRIPLSSEDLLQAERLIDNFMGADITRKPIHRLGEALKPYTEQIKLDKREYKELDIKIPEEAIPIDIIKSEPVTAAIMHPDGWSKGNTRRAAYMAAILNLSGWDADSIHEYIEGIASDWNVGALSHVIDSWIDGMYPPSIPKIYDKGSGYPMMNFGDCIMHLPDKPDYHSPLKEIFRKASAVGLDVSWQDESEDPTSYDETTGKAPEPEPDADIKLEYLTRHLKGYDDLVDGSDLFGDEYKPIFKALWYQLMSFRIRTSDLKIGRNKADGRINALYPLKAGHGKGELKRVIEYCMDYFNMQFVEPTSLHAEQLIGKPIKKRGSDEYDKKYGYLARDWLVIDEAYNLLSSNELHYSEARKYMRKALDRYPGNTVYKETTEGGADAALKYDPICPITLFIQPVVFDTDILVLEGDIRRVICPYVNMTGLNKEESLIRNIRDEEVDGDAIYRFCQLLEGLESFQKFRATPEAINRFEELFFDLYYYGMNYNQKIRNFMDIIAYTLQTFLLKFSAVQAFQHDRSIIQPADVELAYMDLFEIMHHTYQYVNNKIPGFLNYGEGWQGAEAMDQEALQWLIDEGAISEDAAIDSTLYAEHIMTLFEVKDRRAREIIKKHHEKGWIHRKKGFQNTKIWISFKPDLHLAPVGSRHRGYLETSEDNINSINYYLIINNYYTLVDYALNDNPTANCQMVPTVNEDDISDPGRSATLHDNNTTSKHQGNINHHEIITDAPATITAATPSTGTTGTVTTSPLPKATEKKKDKILRAAYESLKYNETSGIHESDFLNDIRHPSGYKEYDDLIGLIFKLDREGYIHQDNKKQLIRPADKLLSRFDHQELVNM